MTQPSDAAMREAQRIHDAYNAGFLWDEDERTRNRPGLKALIAAAIDRAVKQGELQEAAKHADCCVDREERDRAVREEREACAKIVEGWCPDLAYETIEADLAPDTDKIAAAIRARQRPEEGR